MKQNLMNHICLEKTGGWECFDTVEELRNSLTFDWDVLQTCYETQVTLADGTATTGSTIFVSAPAKFAQETAALQKAGYAIRTAFMDGDILMGDREALRLLETKKKLAGVVIDLCGREEDKIAAQRITEHPDEVLTFCVAIAQSLRERPALLLVDTGLWNKAQAMMIYTAAKEAKAPVEIALFRLQGVSCEELKRRRCQIVMDWVLRRMAPSKTK